MARQWSPWTYICQERSLVKLTKKYRQGVYIYQKFSNPGGWPRICPCEDLLYDEVSTAAIELKSRGTEFDKLKHKSVNKNQETEKEISES